MLVASHILPPLVEQYALLDDFPYAPIMASLGSFKHCFFCLDDVYQAWKHDKPFEPHNWNYLGEYSDSLSFRADVALFQRDDLFHLYSTKDLFKWNSQALLSFPSDFTLVHYQNDMAVLKKIGSDDNSLYIFCKNGDKEIIHLPNFKNRKILNIPRSLDGILVDCYYSKRHSSRFLLKGGHLCELGRIPRDRLREYPPVVMKNQKPEKAVFKGFFKNGIYFSITRHTRYKDMVGVHVYLGYQRGMNLKTGMMDLYMKYDEMGKLFKILNQTIVTCDLSQPMFKKLEKYMGKPYNSHFSQLLWN